MLRSSLMIVCTCIAFIANGQARFNEPSASVSSYSSPRESTPLFNSSYNSPSASYNSTSYNNNSFQPASAPLERSFSGGNSYSGSAPLAAMSGPGTSSGSSYSSGNSSYYSGCSYTAGSSAASTTSRGNHHHNCKHLPKPPVADDIFISLYAFPRYFFLFGYAYAPVYEAYYRNLYFGRHHEEPRAPEKHSRPKTAPGYVVIGKDTTFGNVTLYGNSAFLEHVSHPGYGHYYSLKDNHVTCVAMFNYAPLFLMRLDGEKRLWRLLHAGKLNVYDDRPINPSYDNIDKAHIKVSLGGETRNINSFLTISTKRQMVDIINKTYGTKLDARKMTWKELLRYLNQLD